MAALPSALLDDALDDAFAGLYSLADVDMVDADDVASGMTETPDLFRPGALLDQRLLEDYGHHETAAAAALADATTMEDDNAATDDADDDGMGFVDIEHMLLNADPDDAAMLAHLEAGAHIAASPVLTAMALAKRRDDEQLGAAIPRRPWLVPLRAPTDRPLVAVVRSDGSLHEGPSEALPPRYDLGCSSAARAPGGPSRVHRRTFGHGAQSFNFTFAHATALQTQGAAAMAASTTTAKPASRSTTTTRKPRRRQEPQQTATLPTMARRRVLDFAPEHTDATTTTKENVPPPDAAPIKREPLAPDVTMGVEPQAPPQTPPRARVCSGGYEASQVPSTPYRTPVRSVSLPSAAALLTPSAPTPLPPSAFHTPSTSTRTPAAVSVVAAANGAPSFISPAAHKTFEHAAVVHAKDTPGKVDRFEWTIRSPSPLPLPAGDATEDARVLPPPYLRGPTSSPEKRRVHSSTFGSFARSFSFASM